MKLTDEIFFQVIKYTPLISIDLLVSDPSGKILVGWRTNPPAKNSWFVPGGRILKDETIEKAFLRITSLELGQRFHFSRAEMLGIYEHIYPGDNFFNDLNISTHYIVLGFKIRLEEKMIHLPKEQHKSYKWLSAEEILNEPDVHQNVKNYFISGTGLTV